MLYPTGKPVALLKIVLLKLVLVGSATADDVVDVDNGKTEVEVVLLGYELFV